MMQRNDIPALQDAIRALHACESHHVRTVRVREAHGQGAWEGAVEVFDLTDCGNATRCYAWQYREGSEVKAQILLERPTVTSPQRAVQVALASSGRR